jgi:anti-sigma factor RsiW
MKLDHQCRWVKRRLPLLAGGELGVEERRKVERHLIGCPGCRVRRAASADALAALRGLGEESPSTVDVPSLWPALARQIRQSRHASPAVLPWWERPMPRPWGFAGLATALGAVLVASSVPRVSDLEDASAPIPVVGIGEAPAPVVALPAPMAEPEVPAPTRRAPSRGALPDGPRPGELTQAPIKPIEPPSSILRFDYDLDHGTPMTPGNHDPQRTF